jgi:hypothetical protein
MDLSVASLPLAPSLNAGKFAARVDPIDESNSSPGFAK